MNPKHALTLALLAACVAVSAQATDCPPNEMNFTCPAPAYAAYFPEPLTNPGDCPLDVVVGTDNLHNYLPVCLDAGEPPAPASMACTPLPDGLLCEAVPLGGELTYEWRIGHARQLPTPASTAASYFFACSPKTSRTQNVVLRVIGPNGEVATTAATFTCP